MSVLTILANEKQEDPADYSVDKVRGYTFIDTAGHGYLCLGSDDNGYSEALAIARRSNYSYVLDGGLVFLEEDDDATKFLELGLSNDQPRTIEVKATDLAESMGIHVVRMG